MNFAAIPIFPALKRTDHAQLPTRRIGGRLLAVAGVASALALIPIASAAPIAIGDGPGVGMTTQHVFLTDYAAWFVAELTDPITPAPISIAPGTSAGPWTLELTFALNSPALATGDLFVLQELLEVEAGDFPLNRWSQEIITPGWRWAEAAIFDNATSATLTGLNVNLTDTLASFTFAPLAAGTDVFVVKTLEYIGPGGPAAPVTVQASAVPEPGSAGLLLAGLLGISLRRSRRNLPSV